MTNISDMPSERELIAQLRQRLFPKGIRCLKCGRRYDQKVDNRYFCKKDRYKFTLKQVLGFTHSKLPVRTLLMLMHCWLSELSPQDTERITGLSHTTIRRWFRRFSAMIPETVNQLTGITEMDEAFIGKQKFNNQTIVLGAVERQSGRVMLKAVTDREQGTLDRFILQYIRQGSLIWTDAWSGYEHLTEFFGYGHEAVNHSLGSFGPTNRIENVWMRLRRFIKKIYHHIWKEHLPRLLREFQARISYPEGFQSPLTFLSYVFQES